MIEDNEHPLVDRLRWVSEWYFVDPIDGKAYASDDPLDAADIIEGLLEKQAQISNKNKQLEAALTKSEALQDLAYYNGAKQYAAISAQSEDAARDWLNGGCGNRQRDAIAALGDAK